jgi:hypothetical protein
MHSCRHMHTKHTYIYIHTHIYIHTLPGCVRQQQTRLQHIRLHDGFVSRTHTYTHIHMLCVPINIHTHTHSQVVCANCKHASDTYDSTMNLSLEIHTYTHTHTHIRRLCAPTASTHPTHTTRPWIYLSKSHSVTA